MGTGETEETELLTHASASQCSDSEEMSALDGAAHPSPAAPSMLAHGRQSREAAAAQEEESASLFGGYRRAVARRCSLYELGITLAVCTAYMLVGPLLIMSNKYLLTTQGFPYPMMLTATHQLSSALCSAVLTRVLRIMPLEHDVTWAMWRQNIVGVGVTTTAALCTGTSSYLYLTVAFIEILKGFTPVVTMMVQSLFGEPLPTCRVASAVLMISLGTAISSFGELHMSLTGMLMMLASVYCEATRLMLTQRMLKQMNFHVLEGLYHITPTSAICAALAALVFELPHFKLHKFQRALPTSWHLFLLNALLGFLVNVVSFLVIKRTNVVMLKLLAIARNALVVLSGIVFFADSVTPIQVVGYSVSLFFFSIYNYLLLRPQQQEAR